MNTPRILVTLLLLLATLPAAGLEPRLQQAAENALGKRRGAVVVISLPDRKLLALAGPEVARQASPPGSTFKLVTAYAALTEGITSPTARIECRNVYRAGPERLLCIKQGGHGRLSVVEAIAQSCNLHFYTLARRLGPERLEKAALKLGWLEKPLPKRPITPAEVAEFGVGEAPGLSITPLRTAQLIADIAMSPDSRTMPVLRRGMRLAVQHGTAKAAAVPGVAVAGKTGTPTDLAVPGATNAWFIGYAPYENPRVAIAVFVSRGFGFDTAAPIAGKVLRACFRPQAVGREMVRLASRQGSSQTRQEPLLRIGLFRRARVREISFRCLSPTIAKDPSASWTRFLRLPVGSSGTIRLRSGQIELSAGRQVLRAGSLELGALTWDGVLVLGAAGYPARPYQGHLLVRPTEDALSPINEVHLEDYLACALPGEMPFWWPREALAAQAVIARTFALAGRGRHAREGFDLCDLTHCQVYRGRADERPPARAAVVMTRGVTLRWQGKLSDALYHSTCGGRTASAGEIWPHRPPSGYLKPVSDAGFCRESPHFRWSQTLDADRLAEALAADQRTAVGSRVRSVRVLQRGQTGHVTRLRVAGDRTRDLDAELFWTAVCRKLGWGKLKSTAFTVTPVPGGFRFDGRGLGHGVGLCQWGARGMAESGYTWRQILGHYYPGVQIQ